MLISKDLKWKIGVYKLIINNKVYIGSSKNLYKRLHDHKTLLKHNNHHNKKLQNLYNKYLNLDFEILEFCNIENLLEKEKLYIDLIININFIKDPRFSKNVIEKKGQVVYKINSLLYLVNTYKSISELSSDIKITSNTISEAIRLRNYYYFEGYFYLKKLNENFIINNSRAIIIVLDENKNYIETLSQKEINIKYNNGKDNIRYYLDKNKIFKNNYFLRLNTYLKIKNIKTITNGSI